MSMSNRASRSVALVFVGFALIAALPAAALEKVRITEILTSWFDDSSQQYIEIAAEDFSFIPVSTVAVVFDSDGEYIDDLGVFPDFQVGLSPREAFLIGTGFGVTPDVLISPLLPSDGGMVCVGGPLDPTTGLPPADPESWDHTDPENFVDCVAYGSYSGAIPSQVGTPVSIAPNGHNIVRVFDTGNNNADFACGNPLIIDGNEYLGNHFSNTLPASEQCTDPRYYTLASPLEFTDEVTGLSGAFHPATGVEALLQATQPDCYDLSGEPCPLPWGDTFFFAVSLDGDSEPAGSVGGIVTDGSGFRTGLLEDGSGDTIAPTGRVVFGHTYGGSSQGGSFFPGTLDSGEMTDVLFVNYPTGSVARAVADGEGLAGIVFDEFSNRFETGIGPATSLPEPTAGVLQLLALATVCVLAKRRRSAH
jgi:hypothetical protein